MNALGQKRFAGEKYLFVKFDSWNAIDLDLIAEAFPDVPRIFLYRNPIEIIVSHLRRRGMQMIPGVIENLLPDFTFDDILQMSAEEYCARVLGRICQSILKHTNNADVLLINYNQLPEACLSIIPDHFKADYNSENIEKMRVAANFDAKTPQFYFTFDVKSKNEEASDAARNAADNYVKPYYRKLERIRLKLDD